MENVAGKSLHAVITSRERISTRRTLSYCLNMARILADIHAAGWAWLDCKPGNFLCGKNHRLRAVDFEGACRLTSLILCGSEHPAMSRPKRDETNLQADDLFALGASFAQLVARKAVPPILLQKKKPWRKLPGHFSS